MALMNNLLELFRVEAQVRGLRGRLEGAKRYLDAQNRLLNEQQQRAEEIESRRRQTQAKIGNLESEIQSNDERIEKLREELNSAVNNKQYTSVLTELNTIKSQRSELEERLLEEMAAVEELDRELDEIKSQIEERTKVRDHAKAEYEQRESEIRDRLSELEQQRDEAAGRVPENELEVFNELADQYDGEAMAALEEIDRRHREYACAACNMHVPFEQVSLLFSGSDTLVRCGACRRILYLQEETRGTLANK